DISRSRTIWIKRLEGIGCRIAASSAKAVGVVGAGEIPLGFSRRGHRCRAIEVLNLRACRTIGVEWRAKTNRLRFADERRLTWAVQDGPRDRMVDDSQLGRRLAAAHRRHDGVGADIQTADETDKGF